MKRLALLPMLLALAACSGHTRYLGAEVAPMPESKRPVAYVTNPELKRELAILQASQLYRISLNPAAPDKITLDPLEKHPGCGNPMMGTVFTLGMLTSHMSDRYTLGYTLQDSYGTRKLSYTVGMDYSYSLWETFRIFSNDDEELGRALRAAALRPEPGLQPGAIPPPAAPQ